ncbi:MAG: hypothetical protein U0821_06400 [Chloroflexota bacterium]
MKTFRLIAAVAVLAAAQLVPMLLAGAAQAEGVDRASGLVEVAQQAPPSRGGPVGAPQTVNPAPSPQRGVPAAGAGGGGGSTAVTGPTTFIFNGQNSNGNSNSNSNANSNANDNFSSGTTQIVQTLVIQREFPAAQTQITQPVAAAVPPPAPQQVRQRAPFIPGPMVVRAADGGAFVGDSGRVIVRVTPGLAPGDLTIDHDPVGASSVPTVPGSLLQGLSFRLSADTATGPASIPPGGALLIVTYGADDLAGRSPTQLQIAQLNEQTNAWQPLNAQVNESSHAIVAPFTNGGVFAVYTRT